MKPIKLTKKERDAFKRVGRAGALEQSASMTPEQRSERARKAVMARWAKARERAAAVQATTDADLCRHGKLLCPTCDKAFLQKKARGGTGAEYYKAAAARTAKARAKGEK